MVFSSPLFVFLFLPLVLLISMILPKKWKNLFLLIASLLFYAWGERIYVMIMLLSILSNYFFGIAISNFEKNKKIILFFGVFLNLLSLTYFKYANFIIINLNYVFHFFGLSFSIDTINGLSLPIGISFFTFQGLSYLVDVYRKETPPQKSIIDLGLYIALFPQLIAGPIVRYHDIASQLKDRIKLPNSFFVGFERFTIGLIKKLVFANTFAYIADYIFKLNIDEVSTPLAWVGILAYSLQIYFDFSAYSDMAIGIGRMLGFSFLENFNYPYIAKSIQDFWRRWHISLSSWFKDYLYIPLGGSRVGNKRLYINLLIVFFVTGLWHGASWNFVFWGLFHGFFLVLERFFLQKCLNKVPSFFSRLYMLLVVVTAWVFFRLEKFDDAIMYIRKMYVLEFNSFASLSHLNFILINEHILITILGLFFTVPLVKKFSEFIHASNNKLFLSLYSFGLFALLFIAFMYLAAGTYNPFIYFRF